MPDPSEVTTVYKTLDAPKGLLRASSGPPEGLEIFQALGSSAPPEGPGDPPGVGLLIAVVERLQALLLLLLAEACGVRHLEEGGGELDQPARVDGGHLPHVLLGGQHQLVVHHPARRNRP